MAFNTKLRISCAKFYQCNSDTIDLSGSTSVGSAQYLETLTNVTSLTIPTAEWVTGLTSSAILTANNGLNKAGSNVRLGGSLTGNTTIDGSGGSHSLTISGLDAGVLSSNNSMCVRSVADNLLLQACFQCLQINGTGGATFTDGDSTPSGIQYNADYSTDYTPRSLVDAEYVTGITSNSVVTASNGLTKSGQNVKLGGTTPLSETTNICGATNDFNLGTAASRLGAFTVDAASAAILTTGNACVCPTGTLTIFGSAINANTVVNYNNEKTYVPLSLPSAGWVTGKTSALDTRITTVEADYVTGGTNGISSADSHRLKLGGAITENTCVTGAFVLGANMNQVNLTGSTGGVNLGGCVRIIDTPSGSGELVCRNATTGALALTSLAAFGGITGATNGLSDCGSQQIGLGGALCANTQVCGTQSLQLGDLDGVCLSTANTNDIALNAKSNGGVYIKSQSGTVASSTDTTSAVGLHLDFNGAFQIFDNRAGVAAKGICYAADYSNNFVDLSLVNKGYVDSVATGLEAHAAATVATTGNIGLSGLTTVDGIVTTTGMRVLVKDQTNGALNGIYSASTGVWGRTEDYNFEPTGEVSNGDLIPVSSGDTNLSSIWILTTPDPISSGDTLTFSEFSKLLDVTGGDGIDVNTVGINREVSVDLISSQCGLCINGGQLGFDFGVTSSGLTATSGLIHVNASKVPASGDEIAVRFDASCNLIVDKGDFSYTTASNGLTKVDCNVTLGGALTGATVISMAGATSLSFTDTRVGSSAVGLQYTGDYGSTFVARSLVDAAYVTGLTNTIGAANGLSNVGGNIELGGTLTKTTTIAGGSQILSFNALSDFNLTSTTIDLTGAVNVTGAIDGSSTLDILGATSLHSTLDVTGATEIGGVLTLTSVASGAGSDTILVRDGSGVVKEVSQGSVGITTATNGVCVNGTNFVLGGSLTGSTTIDVTGQDITIGSAYAGIYTANDETSLYAGDNYFGITSGATLYISDGDGAGICYAADYSSNYTARSLVDAGYVSGATYLTASNGIVKSSNNFELGGCLVQHTFISGNSSCLGLGTPVSPINTFTVCAGASGIYSTTTTDINASTSVGVVSAAINLTGTVCVTGAMDTSSTLGVGGALTLDSVAAGSVSTDEVMVITSGGEVRKIAADTLGEDNNRYAVDIVTTSTTAPTTGYTLLVSGSSSVTITLPASPVNGQAYKIKDASGDALSSPITISGNGNNIDGSATALINTDYGALELVYSLTMDEWFSMAFIN